VQVLMMSRLGALERWIGTEQIARWHRVCKATSGRRAAASLIVLFAPSEGCPSWPRPVLA
jgi:hypothetical protein